MNEKSHVGMGFSVCPVCGTKHYEVVLLDKRLEDSLNRENFMGWALCPEHDAMKGEYIALVECSNAGTGAKLKQEDAIRTGQIAHVRRTAAKQIFNTDLPDDMPLVFVEVGVIEALRKKVEQS